MLGTLFSCVTVSAQQDNVAYQHKIEIKNYEGHRFRLSASVRAEIGNDSASARLWARVDKQVGYGFFENMWDKPIRNQEWKKYTIEGKIDSGAVMLAFGALCQYNGKFYYDDFKIEIETKNNHWENIFEDNFNKDTIGLELNQQKWFGFYNTVNFKAEIYRDNNAEKGNCLLVIGNGIPDFGINNRAGKYAEVNGIKLYYEIYGEGQPLLVLHGGGCSIATAGELYPYFLEKHYKIIAVDSRGHGRSGLNDAEWTYDLMASDVNELLNQIGVDSVYLFGHSDGAILGLILAMKHPEKVKKLVAFAPNVMSDTTGIEPPIFYSFEKEALTSRDSKNRRFCSMVCNYPDIPFQELNNIKCEVLLMSGDRDFVPLTHTLMIFKNIPNSNLCVIPGSTHWAIYEKKDLFLQLVTDFFEKPFKMPSTIEMFK